MRQVNCHVAEDKGPLQICSTCSQMATYNQSFKLSVFIFALTCTPIKDVKICTIQKVGLDIHDDLYGNIIAIAW